MYFKGRFNMRIYNSLGLGLNRGVSDEVCINISGEVKVPKVKSNLWCHYGQ